MQISALLCGVAVATGATADKDAERRLLPSLPVAPQAAISAAIGYTQKDYNERPIRDGFQLQSPRSGLAAEFTPGGMRVLSQGTHSDVLVRWGGEEFLILSRCTDRREAKTLSARVLAAVSDTAFALANANETICRTCSIGWAAFPWLSQHPDIVNYEKVLNLADRALGEAKRAGKNRAVGLLPAGDQLVPTVSETVYPGYITADVLAIVGTTVQQQD